MTSAGVSLGLPGQLTLVIALCCVSGLADAQGFVHASRVWRADGVIWCELTRSAMGFAIGISSYWLSVRFMPRLGLVTAEMQTLLWFAATIIGVALINGRFSRWPVADQLVAGGVVAGLGWLVLRATSSQ